jgi:cysteine desulfurase
VFASAASSCASGAQEPSHVLAAMGVPRALAQGSLRLSLGWPSTDADVDLALEAVPAAIAQLRRFSVRT